MYDDELFMCKTIEQKAKINEKPLIGEIIFLGYIIRLVDSIFRSDSATLSTNDLSFEKAFST